MSDYRYETDNGGIDIRESVNDANVFIWVHEDRKEAAILIPKAEAPTVAMEILKVAGQESVTVPTAYSDVVEAAPGEYECGDGPERAYGSAGQNPNWLYHKAANYIAIAEYIESTAAREAAEKAEAEAAEKMLQERRDALAIAFSADFTGHSFAYPELDPVARKAIDAYIELQDKLDGASRD